MKRRKVIQLGKDTCVVTLPTTWIKKNNIKKGDELLIDETDAYLKLSPSILKKREKGIVLDYTKLGKFYVWRFVHSAYIKGYDEIKIQYKTKNELKNIESIPRWFIGFAIVKQGKKEIIIRSVSQENSTEFNAMFIRCYNLIKDMLNDASLGANFEELKKRDYMLNSFTEYCLRYIEKYREFNELIPLLNSLERFGDEICQIPNRKLKTKNREKIKEVFDLLYSSQMGTQKISLLDKIKKIIDSLDKEGYSQGKEHLTEILEQIITIKIKEFEEK